MATLDDKIYQQVLEHCDHGDELAEDGKYAEALEQYQKAFELLPPPKYIWQAATWVLTAMGDTYYLNEDFANGVKSLSDAMRCPDAVGNPFIHLRLGQCHYEVGNTESAANELTRAYALEGEGIFEDEKPEYWAFLKTKIQISE